MTGTASFVFIALFLLVDSAHSKWDGLRVIYGTNPAMSFLHQPRLVDEAVEQKYKPISGLEYNASLHYKGVAYAKDDDPSLTLLYDVRGVIAGIQAGVSIEEMTANSYPGEKIRPPFVLDGVQNNRYIITMYFINPDEICTKGRTQTDLTTRGTGEGLWLQTGTFPTTVVHLPTLESDVGPLWVEGRCYSKMGKHYWYNITTGMDCSYFYPVFLMYNNGELNAFGWFFLANLTSDNYERPYKDIFPIFFHEVPEFLNRRTQFSAMHIYLTNDPSANSC